jgi:hypothetical protein
VPAGAIKTAPSGCGPAAGLALRVGGQCLAEVHPFPQPRCAGGCRARLPGPGLEVGMVVGFSSMASFSKPLQDPYLAIAEVLILIMAPVMVLLLVVVHVRAPRRVRIFSINALGWMLLTAGFTMTVHLVELTIVRRTNPDAIHGYLYLPISNGRRFSIRST